MFVSLRGVVMYVVERLRISCLVLELTVGRRNDRSSIQCFFQSLQIMNLCMCNLVHLNNETVARFFFVCSNQSGVDFTQEQSRRR